jgi:hypothetical protein
MFVGAAILLCPSAAFPANRPTEAPATIMKNDLSAELDTKKE